MVTQITAKVGRGDEAKSVAFEYEFGDDLASAIKKFTEKVVFANWTASVTIGAQNYARAMLKADKSAAEIIKAMKEVWKPGLRAPAKSPVEKAQGLFDSLTPEQQNALIKRAQEKRKA